MTVANKKNEPPYKERLLKLKAEKEKNNTAPSTPPSTIKDNDSKNENHENTVEVGDRYSRFRDTETTSNAFNEFTIKKPVKKPTKKKVVVSLPTDIVECIDNDTDDDLNFKQSHVIEQILRHYYTATGKLKK